MEEYRNEGYPCHHRHKWLKYLGCMFATLLGSFLAFYFVANCTMNHFMCRAYAMSEMRKMDKMMMRDFEKMDKDFDKDMKSFKKSGMFIRHRSAIEFIKTPDSYKFIVDLTPFQGNPEALNIEVKDDQISISGESKINTNNSESFTKMSQTYSLGKGAKPDKISKKKVDNKYIITVPIED